jgi:hypothetical protein
MLYTFFLIAFGIYLGQEYHLPSMKLVFNQFMEYVSPKVYEGEFVISDHDHNRNHSTDAESSDTDSSDTFVGINVNDDLKHVGKCNLT